MLLIFCDQDAIVVNGNEIYIPTDMKTIDYSYFIERYISGEMEGSEKKWFEKELESNASLQGELKLRRKTDSVLVKHDLIDLRNKLAAIEKQRAQTMVVEGRRKSTGYRFAAALAALILLGGVYLVTSTKTSNESIYRSNFTAYEPVVTSRSAQSSISKIQMESLLVLGVNQMRLKNFENAESQFVTIIKDGDNLLMDNAQWYLALCYIKTNETSLARTQLETIINSNSIYRDKAKKIIRKLK